jgi:integrase
MRSQGTLRSERSAVAAQQPAPDWFLRDSRWDDVVWILTPTNLLEERRVWSIRWGFTLPSRRRFTDISCRVLLETSKRLLRIIRTHSLHLNHPQRARTVFKYFVCLRGLLRWMDAEGYARFADLDAAALRRFQRSIARRKNYRGTTVTAHTVKHYLNVLVYLYRFRDQLDDGLSIDPCPGQSAYELAGNSGSARHHSPATPEEVAVPLIQGAIDLLDSAAIDILRAREIYIATMPQTKCRGQELFQSNALATQAMQRVIPITPRGPAPIRSVADLDVLIDMLYAACFVVISYLVGPRMSELLQLRAGCLKSRAVPEVGAAGKLTMISGAIFKWEPDYYGRPHEWVAPPAAVHAISVLEALSAPHRFHAGGDQLWLRARGAARHRGASEWLREIEGPFEIPDGESINYLLNRFASWLDLPDYQGKSWRLSSHQGRKTFARFVALRDRTSLWALSEQLGHRERCVTDQGYVGNDYLLNREIDAEVLEQSAAAWEHMLSAPQLGGRAGREILAKRPRFRGVRMKDDLKAYARMLAEAGLTLGVCDYGYCVYRQEYSACLGNASGPNPIRREPSTCARCKNFVVSTHHRNYWLGQMRRCEALLNEPALPTQSLKIVRARLEEARALVRSLDLTPKDNSHVHIPLP